MVGSCCLPLFPQLNAFIVTAPVWNESITNMDDQPDTESTRVYTFHDMKMQVLRLALRVQLASTQALLVIPFLLPYKRLERL